MARGRSPIRQVYNIKSCMKQTTVDDDPATKKKSLSSSSQYSKKVIFDEIMIREYPIKIGDNPAVSAGVPITLGWKVKDETIEDIDFFEYRRQPERKSSRKKLVIPVRTRANMLLAAGYSLEQIVNASMEAETIKMSRAESLRSAGWSNPMELLNGAVETTGTALKSFDVLGVGSAAGAVVGAGAAAGMTVVNVGTDVTMQTGKFLVSGVTTSTRAVADGVTTVGVGVLDAGKIVGTGFVDAGKSMGSAAGKVIRKLSPKRTLSPNSNNKNAAIMT